MKGNVRWFNRKLGYGFITGEDKKDYFVHHTNIKSDGYRDLKQGSTVEFEPSKNAKGDLAINVVQLAKSKEVKQASTQPPRQFDAGRKLDKRE